MFSQKDWNSRQWNNDNQLRGVSGEKISFHLTILIEKGVWKHFDNACLPWFKLGLWDTRLPTRHSRPLPLGQILFLQHPPTFHTSHNGHLLPGHHSHFASVPEASICLQIAWQIYQHTGTTKLMGVEHN